MNLEKAVVSTICYFDIFEYPMTLMQVWMWLYCCEKSPDPFKKGELSSFKSPTPLRQAQCRHLKKGASSRPKSPSPTSASSVQAFKKGEFSDLQNEVESLVENKVLEKNKGFYFLAGRSKTVPKRLAREKKAIFRYKRILKFVRFFRYFPFVRMIAVCNSLAYDNVSKKSDNDFFVVSKKGKVWTARFFIILFAKIFKLRPRLVQEKDGKDGRNNKIHKEKDLSKKMCFSFFVDESRLNLESIVLKNKLGGIEDIYLIYWIAQLYPVYDEVDYFERFWKSNLWIKKFLPNAEMTLKSSYRSVEKGRFYLVKKGLEFLLSPFDSLFKKLQLALLPRQIKNKINVDESVVVRNGILKFHFQNERRKRYYELWKKRVEVACE